MYIDLIVLILLIVAVIFFFRRFSSFVYMMCALDIIYRLLHFLASSIVDLLSEYVGTEGLLYTVVLWGMFILYCIFVFYVIRILFRRK